MPSVSGVLPIRNGEFWVARNLPRILTNLSMDDELIVIDDGSTDKSYSLVKSFAENDPRISIHRTKGVGLVDALNVAVSLSKFEWLARFDVDDFYSRERLSQQKQAIRKDVVAIFSDFRVLRNGTTNLGFFPSPITDSATRTSLLRSQRTAHPSALVDKGALLRSGGYKLDDFPAEDLGLWTRLSEYGELISIPQECLFYNMRSGSISRMNRSLIAEKRDRILENYLNQFDIDYVFNKLSETIEIYRGINHSEERTLLHYWDLMHPLSQSLLGSKRSQLVKKQMRLLLLNPKNLIPMVGLGYFRSLRSFYK